MPKFSKRSLDELGTCHPKIQMVFKSVVKFFDCSILKGKRDKAEQDRLYEIGKSEKKWPEGKHNTEPYSEAVDVTPYPIDWTDEKRFYFFAGFVLGMARQLGVNLRWGGDWNSDTQVQDQNFFDLVHFEIKE